MKVKFVEKNYKIADRFKEVVTSKLEKLDKYFGSGASATVACVKQNKIEKLEITVTNKGLLFRSEVSGENMYNNIDLALPKLEKQIVRNSEKLKEKKKSRKVKEMVIEPFEFLEEEPEELPAIFKKKTFELDPMLVDDARYAIDRLGHDFYVFLNAETGKINVIYRRRDNKFGLIDLIY